MLIKVYVYYTNIVIYDNEIEIIKIDIGVTIAEAHSVFIIIANSITLIERTQSMIHFDSI